MPSESMLAAARSHFQNGFQPRDEKSSIHRDLVAANVLIQNIKLRCPYDSNDVEWHDLEQIHSAIRRAQEYTR